MNIPEETKKELKEGVCVTCCEEYVICMTTDLPRNFNAPVDIEVDRDKGSVLLRNIIKDDPQNPLYIEYYIDRQFVENISRSGKIDIFFVNERFDELGKFEVKLMKEDLAIIRREIGLGN
ncbi:hypothetical protein [Acidianus ambivalens]|uniref:Uncharacterized protein n=1 Tax=Acidianus ambivalens TaxID=2283 RepID=A0A650CSB4_ACIAM|nr:hypothetical protein [Acidianus ambivalens]MQL55070.1 hypothetical protein [Acidianus ambivalens]QGR20625.1 hypothetical protein D1866_00275 [Acidianus ambivalens]